MMRLMAGMRLHLLFLPGQIQCRLLHTGHARTRRAAHCNTCHETEETACGTTKGRLKTAKGLTQDNNCKFLLLINKGSDTHTEGHDLLRLKIWTKLFRRNLDIVSCDSHHWTSLSSFYKNHYRFLRVFYFYLMFDITKFHRGFSPCTVHHH